jgi:hypothetical protein
MGREEVEDVEAVEHASEAISREEARGSLALWFGVLGSPLAWAGHLGANYSLEEWFACSNSAEHKGEILGISSDTVSILLNTAMAAIALASGLVALMCWRKLRAVSDGGESDEADESGDNTAERARWMAFAGMVEGALFLGIILLGYLPTLTLGTCETTP